MKVSGLDALARTMDELSKAMAELDGDITQVTFNPHDPQSIELAIQQVNDAVDQRVSNYAHNAAVVSIANEMKEKYRESILERAAAARLEQGDGDEEE